MLIAARNRILANRLTAKDYVQNGLVAMWDGIENAGWGMHDANATVWKDLSGSSDIPTTLGTLSWEGDALVRTGVNGVSFTPYIDLSNALSPRTIEMRLSAEGLPENISTVYYIFAIESAGIRITAQNTNNIRYTLRASAGAVDTGIRTPSFYNKTLSMVGTEEVSSSDRNVVRYYVDGSLKTSNLFGGNPTSSPETHIFRFTRNWPSTNIIKIHSLRFYNRALTAQEVAANYAVDTERFNLPAT